MLGTELRANEGKAATLARPSGAQVLGVVTHPGKQLTKAFHVTLRPLDRLPVSYTHLTLPTTMLV